MIAIPPLGLVSTIGTAWLFAEAEVFRSVERSFSTTFQRPIYSEIVQRTRVGGEDRYVRLSLPVWEWDRSGITSERDHTGRISQLAVWRSEVLMPTVPDTPTEWVEYGAGFPCICCYKWQEEFGPLHGAIALPDPDGFSQYWPGQSTRGLPYLPIWPGIIANTVFWGGVWWCVLFVPAMVRRQRRIKRGQCAACGYDLSANAAGTSCPECGGAR